MNFASRTHLLLLKDNVATKWLPTNIDGCVLWLRSDLGVTKDGDNLVSAWADQRGQGGYVFQATQNLKPTFVSSYALFNNCPSIAFTNEDFMSVHPIIEGESLTLFCVLRMSAAQINGYSHLLSNSIDGNYLGESLDLSFLNMSIYDDGSQNFEIPTDLGLAGDDDPHIICFSLNISDSISIYVNGGIIEEASDISAGSWTPLWDTIFGGYCETYQCAEILIYNSILSDPNRLLVENYLNGRYVIY